LELEVFAVSISGQLVLAEALDELFYFFHIGRGGLALNICSCYLLVHPEPVAIFKITVAELSFDVLCGKGHGFHVVIKKVEYSISSQAIFTPLLF